MPIIKTPPDVPAGAQAVIIGVPADPAAVPLLVICGACGADVSRSSHCKMLFGAATSEIAVYPPMRCPECNAPAMFLTPQGRVMIPRGRIDGTPS